MFYFLNTKLGFHTLSSCVISLMSLFYILAQTGIWFMLGTFVSLQWDIDKDFIVTTVIDTLTVTLLIAHGYLCTVWVAINWIRFFAPLFIVIVNAAHIFQHKKCTAKYTFHNSRLSSARPLQLDAQVVTGFTCLWKYRLFQDKNMLGFSVRALCLHSCLSPYCSSCTESGIPTPVCPLSRQCVCFVQRLYSILLTLFHWLSCPEWAMRDADFLCQRYASITVWRK